jgi:hypothetical protein
MSGPLPIWFFNELFRPRERPITNVVAVIVMIVTFVPILPGVPSHAERFRMNTKLLINGKLVAGKVRKRTCWIPPLPSAGSDRRGLAGSRSESAVAAAAKAFPPAWGARPVPKDPRRAAAQDRGPHRSRSGRLRAPRIAELRQAVRSQC